MRTISILFLLAILGCQSSKTSNPGVLADSLVNSTASSNRKAFYKPFAEFQGDTLQYLNYNFVEHKDHYIGKPFSVLYNDLEFPVKSSIGGYDQRNSLISPHIRLSFYDDNTTRYRMHSDAGPVYSVIVEWEKPVSADALFKLDMANNLNWSPQHEVFLNGEIIKDMGVMKYVNPHSKK